MSFSCCVEKRILVTQQCRSDSVTSSLRRSKVVRSPAQEQREKLGRRGQIYLPACRGRKGQAGLTSAAQGLHLNPLYQNKRMLSWLKKTLNFKQNWKKKNCIDQLLKQGKGQVIWKSLLGRQRVIMNVFSSVLVLPPSEVSEQLDAQEASLFLLLSLWCTQLPVYTQGKTAWTEIKWNPRVRLCTPFSRTVTFLFCNSFLKPKAQNPPILSPSCVTVLLI